MTISQLISSVPKEKWDTTDLVCLLHKEPVEGQETEVSIADVWSLLYNPTENVVELMVIIEDGDKPYPPVQS